MTEEHPRDDIVKVLCISDTHNRHKKLSLPPCDILVHAGDMTTHGTLDELREFADWLKRVECPHKIVIAGNHDNVLDRAEDRAAAEAMLQGDGICYVRDTCVEVCGLRIVGSPWCPAFREVDDAGQTCYFDRTHSPGPTAFMLMPCCDELRRKREALLEHGEIDILITHSPPAGTLDVSEEDGSIGCAELQSVLARMRPRVHVFGHVHEGYGVHHDSITEHTFRHPQPVQWYGTSGTLSVNAANFTRKWRARPPILLHLPTRAATA